MTESEICKTRDCEKEAVIEVIYAQVVGQKLYKSKLCADCYEVAKESGYEPIH